MRHGKNYSNFCLAMALAALMRCPSSSGARAARGKHEGGRTKIPTERQAPIRTRRRCHLLRGYNCIFRSARRIFLTPAQMQKRLKKRYDARTPQSVSHRAYTRERKRYASTLVLSPHAIVPNCSYLLASSVGIRRVPSRRRSSSNKVAENKKSHVPWRHVRQQRMHRDR